MRVITVVNKRLLQCIHRLKKPRATKVTNMMQLKKGMMVLRQVEQTADQQWGKTAQKRVVLSTRVTQQQETRDRRFQKGMMVGSAAKGRD